MRRGASRLAGASVLFALWLVPAGAETTPERAAFWRRVQALCTATEARPPPASAKGIALKARDEHRLWDGHRIDAGGRLHRFGLVESESEADRAESGSAPLAKVGWWNVWRYWATLDQARLVDLGVLRVTAFANALADRDPETVRPRRDVPLSAIFRAIGAAPPGSPQEAVKESAVRAMMADLPWSAAFVSYVVHAANPALTEEAFAFSSSHMEYIAQAFATSRAEAEGREARTLYRACPIHETRPRPGDLICYQREEACAGLSAASLRDLVALGARSPQRPACRGIAVTHCDVVTDVDAAARKASAVGGNVFQSVAERRLNLAGRPLALSANQGEAACRAARRREGAPATDTARACSLNHRDWFVLLQAR